LGQRRIPVSEEYEGHIPCLGQIRQPKQKLRICTGLTKPSMDHENVY
jgi:hypothetical protein